MFFHRRLMNHFRYFRQWSNQHQAQVYLDMRTFRVGVEWRQQQVIFVPQFYLEGQKQDSYGLELTPEVTGFIGWLPYFNKCWPHALDKILFKQFVQAQGLRTPEFWISSENGTVTDVLIKPAKGSFGQGLRGPFRVVGNGTSTRTQLAEHEFYERFCPGRILKAWYWNEQPVCVEIRPVQKNSNCCYLSASMISISRLSKSLTRSDKSMPLASALAAR